MGDLSQILNFVQLTPRVGTAGQPTREQIKDIARAGYAAVINLALPDSDNAIPEEGSLVSATGMSYIHLPVDFAAPTAQHARVFINIMRALEPAPVFVHCAMNLRVSAFMYLYLRHAQGLDDASARSPILAKWDPRLDPVWRNFLALTYAESFDETR